MNILTSIMLHKRQEVAKAQMRVSLAALRALSVDLPPARGFAAALRSGRQPGENRHPKPQPVLIAEIKKASPSMGLIRADYDPAAIAAAYERGGAGAVSCLTDEKYFQGSLDHLRQARAATKLPILRKDFMVDAYQVWEARAAGADAILLIAAFVSWPELFRLRDAAHEAGLDVLLEIHAKEELEPALELKPDVLGINNRNLRSRAMGTDLEVTRGLAPKVPPQWTLISESGIGNDQDVMELGLLGVDGILVGERLMREADPGAAISEVLGIRPQVRGH